MTPPNLGQKNFVGPPPKVEKNFATPPNYQKKFHGPPNVTRPPGFLTYDRSLIFFPKLRSMSNL